MKGFKEYKTVQQAKHGFSLLSDSYSKHKLFVVKRNINLA